MIIFIKLPLHANGLLPSLCIYQKHNSRLTLAQIEKFLKTENYISDSQKIFFEIDIFFML